MTSWLEKGRPAIFEALAAVCDQIDSDLVAELQDRDKRQHVSLTEEVERLRVRAAVVDKLEEENRVLVGILLKIDEAARQNPPPPIEYALEFTSIAKQQWATVAATGNDRNPNLLQAKRQPLGERSPNTVVRALRDLSPQKVPSAREKSIQKKRGFTESDYAYLLAKYKGLQDLFEQAKAAIRTKKQQRDDWMKYADSLEKKVRKLEKKVEAATRDGINLQMGGTVPSAPIPGKPAAEETSALDTEDPSTRLSTSARFASAPCQNTSFETPADDSGNPRLAPRRAISTPAVIPSVEDECCLQDLADSTQEGSAAAKSAGELSQLSREIASRGSVEIKSEPSSDTPVIMSEISVHKRKRDRFSTNTNRKARRVKREDSNSDPVITGESNQFSPHESIDLDEGDEVPTPKKHHFLPPTNMNHHGPALDKEDCFFPTLDRPSQSESLHQQPSHVITFQARLPRDSNQYPTFRPMSPNRVLLRTYGSHSSPRRREWKLATGITSLTEDGHGISRDDSVSPEVLPPETPGMLSAMLNNPSPGSTTVLLRPTRGSRKLTCLDSQLPMPPRRELPFSCEATKRGSPLSRPNAGNIPTSLSSSDRETPGSKPGAKRVQGNISTPLTSNGGTRLRNTPLASLKLDDFKINPKFNQGQNFAFSEVVRKKSDRAELSACVDPNCCGKWFRAMAQSEWNVVGSSILLQAASVKLLEEYLGDEAYRLGSMTWEEKEALWLEAKTRDLANRHGKHRHRFHRRPSPPGFWNPEFPNTQEMERDREEGERMQRRMVEERWREAMRSGRGGRWLFRDE